MTDAPDLATRLRRLEDLEAVRDLMSRYHAACDGDETTGTHRDPDAIAALFTEDGVYDMPGGPYVGRAAIAGMLRQLQSIAWVIHVAANPILRVNGDTAAGEFKGFVRVRLSRDAEAAWIIGRYTVEAVRGGADGWLFSRMQWTYADDAAAQGDRLKATIGAAG